MNVNYDRNQNVLMLNWVGLITLVSFVTISLSGCGKPTPSNSPPEVPFPLPKLNTKPARFESCEELKVWRDNKLREWNEVNNQYTRWSSTWAGSGAVSVALPMATNANSISAGKSKADANTNVQISGIDEPDFVKADEKLVYYGRQESIEIMDKKRISLIQTLSLPGQTNIRLLVYKERLVAFGKELNGEKVTVFKKSKFPSGSGKFDLETKFDFTGEILDARLYKDQLTIIRNFSLNNQIPVENILSEINCSRIFQPFIDDYSLAMTSVHRFRLSSDQLEQEFYANAGRVDQIFMTTQHLYMFSNGYDWFFWDERLPSESLSKKSLVIRYDVSDKQMDFSGVGLVDGHIRNQFSFNESENGHTLNLATTYSGENGVQENRIWSLEGAADNFAVIGQSSPFGRNEDIRSVRFIKSKAYVVTFEKTDPLFVFNLKNPRKIELLSSLEAPGFSAYLHPVSDVQLLGVGYATVPELDFSWLSGTQFSLFDVSKEENVNLIKQIKFGGRGSHVDAGRDHHAIAFDHRTNLAIFPIRLMRDDIEQSPSQYSTNLSFSGALILDLKNNLAEVGRLSHRELIPEKCRSQAEQPNWWSSPTESLDIRRVIVLDDGYLSLSPFGAKLHNRCAPMETKKTIVFSDSGAQCVWRQPVFD